MELSSKIVFFFKCSHHFYISQLHFFSFLLTCVLFEWELNTWNLEDPFLIEWERHCRLVPRNRNLKVWVPLPEWSNNIAANSLNSQRAATNATQVYPFPFGRSLSHPFWITFRSRHMLSICLLCVARKWLSS